MTTTARTWFYTRPEGSAYDIAERVRTTFWDARVGGIWLDVVQAESPYRMRGRYRGAQVELEWEAARWLRLRLKPAQPDLVKYLSFILGFRPALQFEDGDGWTATEWHTDGGNGRWQAIQGVPSYRNPVHLRRT